MGAFDAHRGTGPTSDEGAVLVEFVLIFPLLMVLIFGVIEASRLGLGYHEAWTAAREGAREASLVGQSNDLADCATIEAAIGHRISLTDVTYEVQFYLPGETTPFADCDTTSANAGDYPSPDASAYANAPVPGTSVIVTVTSPFEGFIIPFMGDVFTGIALDSAQQRTIESGWKFNGVDGILNQPTTTTTTAP